MAAAVQILSRETSIGGEDNGWGRPWTFYACFGEVLANGSESEFEQLCGHANPVVRAMGLLCLKYTVPERARVVAQRFKNDKQDVQLMHGDSGLLCEFGDVAEMILEQDDFCGTRALAEKVAGSRTQWKNGVVPSSNE